MPGYGTLTNQFRAKWGKNPRLAVVEGYIGSRLAAIDSRLFETFRYSDPLRITETHSLTSSLASYVTVEVSLTRQ